MVVRSLASFLFLRKTRFQKFLLILSALAIVDFAIESNRGVRLKCSCGVQEFVNHYRKSILRLSDSELIKGRLKGVVGLSAARIRIETSAVRIQIDLFGGNVRNRVDSRNIL